MSAICILPVDPLDNELTESLKILISSELKGFQLTFSTDFTKCPQGNVPTLVYQDSILTEGNAVLKLLFKEISSEEYEWLSWEEKYGRDLNNFSKVEQNLSQNAQLFEKSELLQVLIFSAVFPFLKQLDRFPHLQKLISHLKEKSAFQTALKSIQNHCSAESFVKINPKVIFQRSQEIPLPQPNQKNILITSALPYVNNVPHLGNIIGCVLSADVFARFCRMRKINALYICGTDEYGTATETKALQEGISCQEICDKYHGMHKEIYQWFDIDFDIFGRTTTPKHTKISQEIFLDLNQKGLLLTDTVQQLYCENCQRFLADRLVNGICPKCQYADARGDQCDGCGETYDAMELVEPKCSICKHTPVSRTSEHMFLDLPRLESKCKKFVEETSESGFWSQNGKNISFGWLKTGLQPRCITRDLKWGTPVPLDNMKGKVLYVWFDAPIGYLSITANLTDQWEKWWKNPEQVQLYQFMGKDNVPFHTVIFPCTLLGTEQPWTLLHHLSTTEYLNYEGSKFSKSRGVGVFGSNVMESGIPVSIWRYCLLANRPESNDSSFTWKDLAARTNGELLANLGNFINRTLKFLKAKFGSFLPAYKLNKTDESFIQEINQLLKSYNQQFEEVKIRAALKTMMDISARGNQYLQENKLDNTLFEKEKERCQTVIYLACNLIFLLGALIYPFMPSTTEDICKQLNAPLRLIPDTFDFGLLPGHRIGTPDHLFKRIEDSKIEELKMKFGGDQKAVAELEKKQKEKKKAEHKKK